MSNYNDIKLAGEFLLVVISGLIRRSSKCLSLCLLCIVVLLGGCATAPIEPVLVNVTSAAIQKQQVVDGLLAQAERDVLAGRLTSPYGHNAYDRFQGVLRLQPGNLQAISGLQLILMRYVSLGRQALKRDKPAQAKQWLGRARKITQTNPLLEELQSAIAESLARQSQQRSLAKQGDEILLNVSDLSARSSAIKSLLQRVADRIRQSDESVLIVARNDAEGRWLYQQLRQAASGYRIRGDIRVESTPKLRLLPPL